MRSAEQNVSSEPRAEARANRLRLIVIFAASILVVWILACAAIGIIAVEGALHLPHMRLTAEDRERALIVAYTNGAVLSEAEIIAADGAELRAWSIQPHRENGSVVILLHGQGDNRAGMLGPADILLRHGYSVILPDARGHGESGGTIATYGVLEADDVRRWFEWVKKNRAPECIDGLGDSMGGAELLRSLDSEQGFCAVVAESPFSSFQEAAFDRLGQQFSRGPLLGRTLLRPAFYAGLVYARLRYGVDLAMADPARAVAGSSVPVMLIHGLADTNLPPRHSERIKAGASRVVLWEPKTADHCEASTTDPVEYERRVTGWFSDHDRR